MRGSSGTGASRGPVVGIQLRGVGEIGEPPLLADHGTDPPPFWTWTSPPSHGWPEASHFPDLPVPLHATPPITSHVPPPAPPTRTHHDPPPTRTLHDPPPDPHARILHLPATAHAHHPGPIPRPPPVTPRNPTGDPDHGPPLRSSPRTQISGVSLKPRTRGRDSARRRRTGSESLPP